MATARIAKASYGVMEGAMEILSTTKELKRKLLKQDEKAHEAQAKADKLQRKALDNGKTKKAEKAQDKADDKAEKATATRDDEG
jgi:hypothetical protein